MSLRSHANPHTGPLRYVSNSLTYTLIRLTRVLRPSGPPGASATAAVTYAYVGCYVHSGIKTSTTGLALSNYVASYPTTANDQCRKTCSAASWNYFGTVNVGTTTVDCYCGNQIQYVTS